MPPQDAGATSASGTRSDIIQDGGRKRKLHLHLDGASKILSILLVIQYGFFFRSFPFFNEYQGILRNIHFKLFWFMICISNTILTERK